MLPPHELKNQTKKFPLAIRGYAQTDVNEYIEYLIEKYTEVYKANDSLERELRIKAAKLEELEAKEDAINRALVNAQKLQDRIVNDAKLEAEAIENAAKTETGRLLADFAAQIRQKRATLIALSESVEDFKNRILEELSYQSEAVTAISGDVDLENWDRSDAEFVMSVVTKIREAAEKQSERNSGIAESDGESGEMGEFLSIGDESDPEEGKNVRKKRPRPTRTIPGMSKKNDETDLKETKEEEQDENLRELFRDE